MSCKSVIHDAVPIVARFSNHDFLPERFFGCELFSSCAEGLLLLGAIDGVESDVFGLAVMHHSDGIPVDHADHLPSKIRCDAVACVEEYGKQEKNENERRMQCTSFGDKSVDKSYLSLHNPLGTHRLSHCLLLGH